MLGKKTVGRPRKDDPGESSWNDEQLARLFDYWAENLQAYKTGKRLDFFKGLADVLKTKTAVQCRSKVAKLNAEYGAIKRGNNESGAGPKQWKHFEKMDGLFGHRENVVPSNISGSMDDLSTTTITALSLNRNENAERSFFAEDAGLGEARLPATPTPACSSRKRRNSQLDSWMEIQRESLDLKRLKMEQDFALESQKLEAIRAESSLRLADFEARRILESKTLELKIMELEQQKERSDATTKLKMMELEQQKERSDATTRMLVEQVRVEQEKVKLMFVHLELKMKKLEEANKD
jgi:hypothetical protein